MTYIAPHEAQRPAGRGVRDGTSRDIQHGPKTQTARDLLVPSEAFELSRASQRASNSREALIKVSAHQRRGWASAVPLLPPSAELGFSR